MIMVNACRTHRVIVASHQIVIRVVGITAVNVHHVLQNIQHAQMEMILHVWRDIIKTVNRAMCVPKTQTVPRAARKFHVWMDIIWMPVNAQCANPMDIIVQAIFAMNVRL